MSAAVTSVTRNGGSAVVDALVAEGVEVVFGIPGTHNLELYRALGHTGIRHVTARHEQGVGYAADGYSRVTGRPGVCFVTSGPAVNNITSAVGSAHADSVPLLVVAPGPPRGLEGADIGELHEMRDQQTHMAGVAERSVRVASAADAAAVVHETFARWRAGRRRPVFLEVPLDVLTEEWDGQGVAARVPDAATLPTPLADDFSLAARRLAEARTPVMLVGRGGVEATAAVRRLAELLDSPVVTTLGGKGVLPETHALSVGSHVRLAPAQELMSSADVVLIVGTGLSDAELWGWKPDFSGTTIRVDVDERQLGANHVPTVALHADAETVLSQLADLLSGNPRTHGVRDREGAARAAAAREASIEAAATEAGVWAGLNTRLAAALPPATIVAGDSSQVTYYGTAHHWPAQAPMQLLYTAIYATLGYGLPAAIGAKIGRPETPVIALVGDGAFMFSVAELVTAVEQRLTLPVVVVNNHGYTEIRDGMVAGGIAPVGVDLVTPDFAALGRAFGARGVSVESVDELIVAVLAALDADGPTVIEVDAAALGGR